MLNKQKKLYRRHQRVRARIFGMSCRPRLSVFRSLKHIYAQIIDDEKRKTLVAASDQKLKKIATTETRNKKETQKKKIQSFKTGKVGSEPQRLQEKKGKINYAYEVGKLIAQKALKKNIKKVVFDRGSFKYHGRIKALAEGARKEGLIF